MDRKKLADEIRGAGNALRFADGPVVGGSWRGEKFRSHHSPLRKLKATDSDIIRMASTCSTCSAFASRRDREAVVQMADCYQSFARLIWPCIDHVSGCTAQPYIEIDEQAARVLAKAKKKLAARRQAKNAENARPVIQPRNLETQIQQSEEIKKAAKKIASLEVELAAARKALRKKKRPAAKKAVRKRSAQGKKKAPKRKKS
jgi:hypothetical protein